jgi:predicted acylesterase/phospholipase RssA
MDTILYVGAPHPEGDPLGLSRDPRARRLSSGAILYVLGHDEERRVVALSDPEAAAAFMRREPVSALIVDTRVHSVSETEENSSAEGPFALTRAGRVLSLLFPQGEVTGALVRDRILGIVGPHEAGTQAAFHLGTVHIGTVMTSPSRHAIMEWLDQLLSRPAAGRIAICLAGGGIEGLFYEIGVLRALESFLADRSIVDFDLFCGISAGAVLGAFLANGIGPDEIARGLTGQSGRIDPISRRELFDPNVGELSRRALRLAAEALRGGTGPRGLVSSLSRAVPSAAFAGDGLRAWMKRNLEKPGMSDRFDGLRRPLFIGATDQDTSEAVVFGEEGQDHVPLHRAVRASSALTPFYAPEQIDGRLYIDGAFTRTTNMRVAVRNGATMVILIDPLVPVFSAEAGYVHARGGIFGAMQGLKSLINGRFDKAANVLREMYPDVSFHLFRPEGDEMRILSGSPMKLFYRSEVEDIAYQSTVSKIRDRFPELARDFASHGVRFRDPDDENRSVRPPARFSTEHLGL